jgi:hypothetical protein
MVSFVMWRVETDPTMSEARSRYPAQPQSSILLRVIYD